MVGASTTLTIQYELCGNFPTGATVVLQVPKLNGDYESLGNPTLTSMFPSSGITATVAVQGGSSYGTDVKVSYDVTVEEEDSDGVSTHEANGKTYDQLALEVTGSNPVFAAGSEITVTIDRLNMPISTKTFESFVFYTATDMSLVPPSRIERAKDGTAAGEPSSSLDMVTPGAASAGVEFLEETDGVGTTNAHYGFTFTTDNPIPTAGYLQITVPAGLSAVNTFDSTASGLVFDCTAPCSDTGPPQMTYASSILTIKNIFNSYVDEGTTIKFSLQGWTNPTSTTE